MIRRTTCILRRCLAIGALCVPLSPLLLGTPGCDQATTSDDITTEEAAKVTPAKYWDMPPHEQAQVRSIPIYVPDGFGFYELPPDAGPWASPGERLVHQGETDHLVHNLARAVFEFEHPQILMEFIPFDMWSPQYKALLSTSMHSERSPAMYIARSLPDSMVDRWYADITDHLDDWPEARDHRLTRAAGTFDGRIYCLPGKELQWAAMAYRKDYFEEIGVTNEHGEYGPPSNWTWSDFREFARRLTRVSDDGKIERWGFVAEQHYFDLNYVNSHGLQFRLVVPDKSGEFIWRFNGDDPKLIEGIQRIREMYWIDRSVLAGAGYNWTTKEREFSSDKVAMAAITSYHPAEWALFKPAMFPGKTTIEELGVVPIPRADPVGEDDLGYLFAKATSNMYGFNPTYSEIQLEASIDWFKSYVAGFDNAIYLMTMREKNEAWDRPDPFPLYELIRTYPSTVPLPEMGESLFPPDYRRVYDIYDDAELFPAPTVFGLLPPPQFNDALNNMFSELLFAKPNIVDGKLDPVREHQIITSALQTHTGKIEARCMKTEPKDAAHLETIRGKMKAYYEAVVDYAKRNMPPSAAAEIIAFVEDECRCR